MTFPRFVNRSCLGKRFFFRARFWSSIFSQLLMQEPLHKPNEETFRALLEFIVYQTDGTTFADWITESNKAWLFGPPNSNFRKNCRNYLFRFSKKAQHDRPAFIRLLRKHHRNDLISDYERRSKQSSPVSAASTTSSTCSDSPPLFQISASNLNMSYQSPPYANRSNRRDHSTFETGGKYECSNFNIQTAF